MMPVVLELTLSLFMAVIASLSVMLAWMFAKMWPDDPVVPVGVFVLRVAGTGGLPFLLQATGFGVSGQFPSFVLTIALMVSLGLSRFGERLVLANGLALVAGVQVFLDLSRFCAAPSARLSHLSLESDRAFPTQC